jgi:phage host-nuclease inhibitor protein Gam
MKEALLKRCEDRASKLHAHIVDLEKETQRNVVEVNDKIKSVEEMQCQRISEAKDSQATIVTELVEHKKSVKNSLSMFRSELVEIKKGTKVKVKVNFTLEKAPKAQRGSRDVDLLFL